MGSWMLEGGMRGTALTFQVGGRVCTKHADKINVVLPTVWGHLSRAQKGQWQTYDWQAQTRGLGPPSRPWCHFLTWWQGLCTVEEQVGQVNYHLRQPGKKGDTKLYYINLLKPWIEPLCPDLAPIWRGAPSAQQQDLEELCTQHVLWAPQVDPCVTAWYKNSAWCDHLPAALPGTQGKAKSFEAEVDRMLRDKILLWYRVPEICLISCLECRVGVSCA